MNVGKETFHVNHNKEQPVGEKYFNLWTKLKDSHAESFVSKSNKLVYYVQ